MQLSPTVIMEIALIPFYSRQTFLFLAVVPVPPTALCLCAHVFPTLVVFFLLLVIYLNLNTVVESPP